MLSLKKEHYADQTIGKQENVVIDMSSPQYRKTILYWALAFNGYRR